MLYDMNETRSLLSFVGLNDPYPESSEDPGPLLSLLLDQHLRGQPFDEVWLLCSGSAFLERARDLEREAREEGLGSKFYFLDFAVRDVIDYAEIWSVLLSAFGQLRQLAGRLPRLWHVLLDSGTPQMKSTLFLAVRAGLFPARVLQGIPARYAGGVYKVRAVDLEALPQVQVELPPKESECTILFQDDLESEMARAGLPAPPQPYYCMPGIVGESSLFYSVIKQALGAARYDDPMLILGETGTGKTLIARRIHEHSSRSTGPFVEVNCSAISASLAESELFGHIKGAYSGADKPRAGKFRAAHGGTIFLDEVGDLAPELQAKLLKAIEDREVTPVGSDTPVPADARLLAATNRDLEALVAERLFRRDLYERLKGVVVRLPPLRERRGDIPDLARHFLLDWNKRYNEKRVLTPEAMSLLRQYDWPGNIRELSNALRSAACLSSGDSIGAYALPDAVRLFQNHPAGVAPAGGSSGGGTQVPDGAVPEDFLVLPESGFNLKARLLQIEWAYVSAALRRCGNNREAAAKLLGLTGHAFRKALKERLAVFIDESLLENGD